MQQTKQPMTPEDFGKLVRRKRTEKGLTAEELARAVGVTKGSISNWENGKAKKLQTANLMALSRTLGLDGVAMIEQLAKHFGDQAVRADPEDIPPHRLDLIRMYGRLPKDLRTPIRLLIQTLAAMHHDGREAHEDALAKKSAEIRARHKSHGKTTT